VTAVIIFSFMRLQSPCQTVFKTSHIVTESVFYVIYQYICAMWIPPGTLHIEW